MYKPGELLERLIPLDEDELIYRELFYAKQNKDTHEDFLRKHEDFRHNELLLVENTTAFSFCLKEENILLFDNLESNICVLKHKRYSPMRGHSHTFFEMIYVLKGSCDNIIEGTPIRLNEGDICIMSSDVTHAMSVFDDSLIINILIKKTTFKETFFKLLKDDNILSTFFTRILYTNNASNYILFHTKGDIRLHTLLEYLIWDGIFEGHKNNSDLREYLLLASFHYMLENHVDNIELPKTVDTNIPNIVQILRYIKENYKTIKLGDLARHFNYAPNYISNLIKSTTGYTFSEILIETKLRNACKFLRDTSLPVHEIAHMVGYDSNEHFHRVFKKYTGYTPNEYRTM